MPHVADDLRDWTFTAKEVSAGVYVVKGRDASGRSVSMTGEDPEKLLQDARAWALKNTDSRPTPPEQAV